MLCFQCIAVLGDDDTFCADCGSALGSPTVDSLRAFTARARDTAVERAITQWRDDETIDGGTAERLRHAIRMRAEAEEARRLAEALAAAEASMRATLEPEQWREDEAEVATTTVAVTVIGMREMDEALDAVVALDVKAAREPSALVAALYENVGWFIGALLVLAGSIYGVREAWSSLDDSGRFLTVGGAFFAYHAGFIGLGALLAKKGPRAGQALSGIGMLLLPITAVAFMRLLGESRNTGIIACVAFLAASAFTLRMASRRFTLGSGWALTVAMLPALAAILPLAVVSSDSMLRFALPLGALA